MISELICTALLKMKDASREFVRHHIIADDPFPYADIPTGRLLQLFENGFGDVRGELDYRFASGMLSDDETRAYFQITRGLKI